MGLGDRGIAKLAAITIVASLSGCASTTKPGAIGITRQQLLIVPAATVERMALVSYAQQAQKAQATGRLISSGEEYNRLVRIAKRLRAQAPVFRDDLSKWKWQLVLINAPVINATCAPGGKITFYTGILRQLNLTDDEVAAVMGHEIAHALREHGREKVSQAYAQKLITSTALAAKPDSQAQVMLANQFAQYMFVLPNSRQNESEADAIGLELAARAGYDPRAAITLWQKMEMQSKSSTPQFLSTHPAHATRIQEIQALLPKVIPLYEAAPKS